MSVTVELPPCTMMNLSLTATARPGVGGNVFFNTPPLRRASPGRFQCGTAGTARDGRSPSPCRMMVASCKTLSAAAGTSSSSSGLTAGYQPHSFHLNHRISEQCTASKSSSSSSCKSSQKLDLSTRLSQIKITATTSVPSAGTGAGTAAESTESPVPSPPSSPKSIQAGDLAERIHDKDSDSSSEFFVLDCRSFIAFNLNHISGSLNVCCSDRCSRRRLTMGKSSVLDMVKGTEDEKDSFKDGVKTAEIILYDDCSKEVGESPDGKNSLPLIYKILQMQGANVVFLYGGIDNFHKRYPALCSQCVKPSPRVPLYSPTTPLIQEPAIDTATASMVLPFLYLGNERDACNEARLRELGITHVLNVTAHIPLHFEAPTPLRLSPEDAPAPLRLTYRRLPASDSGQQNLRQYFNDACSFIDSVRRVNGRVLVHCQAGVSRSATITIAYIMHRSNLRMHDAFRFVKSQRAIVSPNFNFMGQLYALEQALDAGEVSREEVLKVEAPPAPPAPSSSGMEYLKVPEHAALGV